jgi:hypothetical protein
MGFGVVTLPSRHRGHHRLCMTSLSLSSSLGELFATGDNDNDDHKDGDDDDDNNDNNDRRCY